MWTLYTISFRSCQQISNSPEIGREQGGSGYENLGRTGLEVGQFDTLAGGPQSA